MSQNKFENGSAGAVPIRIALQPEAVAANDIDRALLGPLGLPRTYWMLWCGMLLNRLGGTIFLLLGLYLTRERGLTPALTGVIISLYAAGGTAGRADRRHLGRSPRPSSHPARRDGGLGGVDARPRLRPLDRRDHGDRAGAGLLHRRLPRAVAGGGGRRRAAARPGARLRVALLGDQLRDSRRRPRSEGRSPRITSASCSSSTRSPPSGTAPSCCSACRRHGLRPFWPKNWPGRARLCGCSTCRCTTPVS